MYIYIYINTHERGWSLEIGDPKSPWVSVLQWSSMTWMITGGPPMTGWKPPYIRSPSFSFLNANFMGVPPFSDRPKCKYYCIYESYCFLFIYVFICLSIDLCVYKIYIYIFILIELSIIYIYIPTVHLRPALLAPAGSGGTAAAAVPRPQRSPRSAAAPGRNTRSRPGGRGPWPRSPGPGAVSFGRDFCGEKYGKIPKRWENGHFVMDRNGALELGK